MLLVGFGESLAQTPTYRTLEEWNTERLHRQRNFARGLTAFGLGSAATAAVVGYRNSSSAEERAAADMTLGWAAVNTGLGIAALVRVRKELRGRVVENKPARALQKTRNVLLFNAGLDVGYIAGGLYLHERGRSDDVKDAERLRGWGRAVMIQGFGLFVIDLVGYLYLREPRLQVQPIISGQGTGIGFSLEF